MNRLTLFITKAGYLLQECACLKMSLTLLPLLSPAISSQPVFNFPSQLLCPDLTSIITQHNTKILIKCLHHAIGLPTMKNMSQ